MPKKTPPATVRSAVTNGKRLFIQGDGRGPWARRFKDLVALHVEDLGGSACISEAQASLIRRCAAIEVELEQLEGQMSQGSDVDLDRYVRMAGGLRRILETLGIERKPRNVTPDLKTYLREKYGEQACPTSS